jgi:hypothetical protein
MHRLEDWATAFRVAGVNPNYGRQLKKRGKSPIAFGFPVAGSIPYDVDSAFIAAHREFATLQDTDARGLTLAGRLMSLHWDALLTALGLADVSPEPVFLVMTQDVKAGYRMAQGLFSEIAAWPIEKVAAIRSMRFLNVTDLLARLRENARKIGLDLSDPFFVPPTDPLFEEVMAEGDKEREEVRARVRAWLEARQ